MGSILVTNEDGGAGADARGVSAAGDLGCYLRRGLLGCLSAGLLVSVAGVRAQDAEAKSAKGAEVTGLDQLADRQEGLFEVIITEGGLVRYDVLAKPEYRAELQALVRHYAELPIPKVEKRADAEAGVADSANHDERLVFLINAYNLNVLEQVIVTGMPQSVLDVAGFFDEREITVGGIVLTLNSLENSYVRTLGDPRIHAALNCAALSCPALARKAFRVQTLDVDLDELCRRWVNDAARNSVKASGEVEVSQIFDWFASDFTVAPFGDRIGFLKYYVDADSALGRALAKIASGQGDEGGLRFMEYDWQLNAAPIEEAGADQ